MKKSLIIILLLTSTLVKAQSPSLIPGYTELTHPTGHGVETIQYEKFNVKTKDSVKWNKQNGKTFVHKKRDGSKEQLRGDKLSHQVRHKEFSHLIITVTLVDGKVTAISKPKRVLMATNEEDIESYQYNGKQIDSVTVKP